MTRNAMYMIAAMVLAMVVTGCGTQTCIIANTDTMIGLQATYQPEIQLPTGKLGYARHEIVIVPTNRVSDDNPEGMQGDGAKDSANVITEFNFSNFFSFWRTNGIYQRIAVGDIAVTQPGAAVMFAKDDVGQISEAAASAIKALTGGSSSQSTDERVTLKTELVKLSQNETVKKVVVDWLASKGITWDAFIDDKVLVTIDEIKTLLSQVKK